MGLVPRDLYFLRNGTEAPKTPGTPMRGQIDAWRHAGGRKRDLVSFFYRTFTVERNLVLSIPGYHLGLTAHHQATHLGCFRVIPDRYILKYLRRARQSSVVRLMLLVLST